MAINPNDDYEKLAKLLYPSIEASGNVYYGQTRKLSLDELFNKDDLWFDAHIESDRPTVTHPTVSGSSDPYDSGYTVYFYWNLAGMNDCIQIRSMLDKRYGPTFDSKLYSKIVFEDYKGEERVIRDYDSHIDDEAGIFTGAAFIKYKLNISSAVINNEVNSGNFTSYEKSITLGNKSVYITELPELHQQEIGSTPETDNSVDKRNFYIFEESDGIYLYVKVCTGIIGNSNCYIGELDNSDYLSIKAIDGNINFSIYKNLSTAKYQYSYDGLSWFNFSSLEPYLLRKNESILVKCTYKEKFAVPLIHGPSDSSDDIEYVDPTTNDYYEYYGNDFDDYLKYTTFEFTKVDEDSNASIEISGNMLSLCPEPDKADQYLALFANLFKDCTLITKANIFFKNIELLDSQSPYRYWHWFYNTFSGCTSLQRCETLPAIDINAVNESYEHMFYGCHSLNRIKLADGWTSTSPYGTYDWLYCQGDGVIDGNNNDFSTTGLTRNEFHGIPRNWYYDSIHVPLNVYCTNGTVYVRLTDGSSDGSRRTFQYSQDGTNWSFWNQTDQMPLSKGNRFYFKRNDNNDNVNTQNQHTHLEITYSNGSGNSDRAELYGNIRSIVQTEDFHRQNSSKNYEYYGLFKDDAPITKAPKIPDTSLSGHACHMTFSNCTNLVEAPEIHAVTLGSNCCQTMFQNCTSLVEAPELPALTLAQSCYQSMFNGCTSLRKAPKLLAIAAKQSCYQNMFFNCRNLRSLHCDTSSDDLNSGFSSWLRGTSETAVYLDDGTSIYVSLPAILYTSNKDTAFWKGIAFLSSKIPKNWYLDNYQKLSGNKFNDDSDKKPGIVVSSGANSIENGRGILINNTIYNMLKKNPFTNKPRTLDSVVSNSTTVRHSIPASDQLVSTDTYDYVGSYNQEIWGYKSFNSPIAFRNGVYGETASLIATTSDTGENVTRLSLYDCTLNGNDASLINNPYIQLGYTVDNESNKSESVIELKANKIVIDGALETSGSSGGLIPFIPATKGPDVAINDPDKPAIGEIIRVTAQYIQQTSSDERWSDDGNWEYIGFPKQNIDYSNNGQYKIYFNENNDYRVQYARFDVESSPGDGNVYYSDSIDGDYMNWEVALPQGSAGSYTVRFGNWTICGYVAEYTDAAMPDDGPSRTEYSITVYENEWAYTSYRYYGDGSMGATLNGQGYDYTDHIAEYGTPPNQEPSLAGTYYNIPVENYKSDNDLEFVVGGGTGDWIEILPTNSVTYHNVYYNNSNSMWKIYNETTRCYINALGCDDFNTVVDGGVNEDEFRDENDNIVLDNEDSPFNANDSNWKHFGIFSNPDNSLINKYCFNGKINGITVEYIDSDDDETDIYMYNNSISGVTTSELNENTNEEAIESFGNQFVQSEPSQSLAVKNIHYGTVLTYSYSSNAWKLGSYDVKLYILPLKYYTAPSHEISYLPQYYSTIDGAQIVALTSAKTNVSGSISNPSNFFEGENVFYAQRIK